MTAETVEEIPVEPEEIEDEEWPEEDFAFEEVEPSLSLWQRLRDWLGSFRRRDDDYLVTPFDALTDYVVAQRKLGAEQGRVALLQVAAILAPTASEAVALPDSPVFPVAAMDGTATTDPLVATAFRIAASGGGQLVEPPSILDLGELTAAQKAALVVKSFGLNPNNLN